METLVAFVELAQQEGFKKPGGVRQVPFRRAYIRHRLNDVVFSYQWFTQGKRIIPDGQEMIQ